MQNENFSPEDSIRVIQAMIEKTKFTVADNSYYFLLWGWLVFIGCIGQFVLKVLVQYPYHYLIWNITFIGIIFSIYHGVKGRGQKKAKTYVSESLDNLWIAIVVSYILFDFAFVRFGWEGCYTFYMMLYALGCFVTGRVLKFYPLIWGAIGSWCLALISTFTPIDYNILLCGLAILISYIIPGHLLKRQYRKLDMHV